MPVEKIKGGYILLREQVGTILRSLFPADESKGKGKAGEKPALFAVGTRQILKYLQWLQFVLLRHDLILFIPPLKKGGIYDSRASALTSICLKLGSFPCLQVVNRLTSGLTGI